MSPISSSSTVPFCASSKHPARRSTAPVNAPFSWPNSSLSISVSGMAAQLMATKRSGAARAESVDRARGQLLAGSAFAGDQHRGAAGRDLLDQRENLPHLRRRADHFAQHAADNSTGAPAVRCVRASRLCAAARSSSRRNSCDAIGFSRNQNAPRSCTTLTAVSRLPNAVCTIAGGASPCVFQAAQQFLAVHARHH